MLEIDSRLLMGAATITGDFFINAFSADFGRFSSQRVHAVYHSPAGIDFISSGRDFTLLGFDFRFCRKIPRHRALIVLHDFCLIVVKRQAFQDLLILR